MKAYVRRPLLKVVFSALAFLLLFYLSQRQAQSPAQYPEAQKPITAIEAQKVSPGFPVRLLIPAIDVNAGIQPLGVTPKGEMEVPSNALDAGWYKFGPRPGETGSAVIAGHFNGESGEAGVFAKLSELKEGNELFIEDDTGKFIAFVVRASRTYDPGYADEVFSRSDGVHLNLITCEGAWDETKKSYSKRLVVFADLVPQP